MVKRSTPSKSAKEAANVSETNAADASRETHQAEESGGESDASDVIEVEAEVMDLAGPDVPDVDVSRAIVPRKGSSPTSQDPLQAYMREVARHPLLTPDEERTLTREYVRTQDVQVAARLVTANLRLVVKLAYEYRRAYQNVMDLIQEGNIGLMQAVKKFDPERGVKLSSYAAWWIRAYMLRFILNNWRLVKLGTTQAQRKLFFNLNKEKARLTAMGIEPTMAEIAHRLDVDEKDVIEMDRRLSSGEASLDAPVGEGDGKTTTRLDLMKSYEVSPELVAETRELAGMLHERLERFRTTLKGKDVLIFDRRMAAEDPVTLQELGDEFGVSRERVRQLEARLSAKLRNYLKDELGDAVGPG